MFKFTTCDDTDAIDTIYHLQMRIKELEAELEKANKANQKMALDNIRLRCSLYMADFGFGLPPIPSACIETNNPFNGKAVYIGNDEYRNGLEHGRVYTFNGGRTIVDHKAHPMYSDTRKIQSYYPGCPGMRFDDKDLRSGKNPDWVVVKED